MPLQRALAYGCGLERPAPIRHFGTVVRIVGHSADAAVSSSSAQARWSGSARSAAANRTPVSTINGRQSVPNPSASISSASDAKRRDVEDPMATKLSRALLGESASAGSDLAISLMSASILSWRRSASACSRARTSSDNSRVTVMRQAYGQSTRPGSASVRPTPAAPRPQKAGRVSQPSRSLDGLDGDVDSCLGGELTGDGGLLTGLVRQVLQTGLERWPSIWAMSAKIRQDAGPRTRLEVGFWGNWLWCWRSCRHLTTRSRRPR